MLQVPLAFRRDGVVNVYVATPVEALYWALTALSLKGCLK